MIINFSLFLKQPLFRINKTETPEDYMEKVQCYLNKLGYNYTGMQFFPINRNAPIERLREVVKVMIKAALPIKCLEATILSIFLTQGQEYFKRFTISFVSEFNGNIFRHVVLGICSVNSVFGALGLSRRKDLMYKPLKYPSLSSLINDFVNAYRGHHHKLIKVKIGIPIPHRPYLLERIHWKGISISFRKGYCTNEINTMLDRYSRFLRGSTDVIIKRNLPALLPKISPGSCATATKGQQPTTYNKVIRLNMVRNKTDYVTPSLTNPANKWICISNSPLTTSISERNPILMNSYQIRI
ncbi:unnamed protein product [Trichobilharzia szidati]|nr:unnamed protein product [Trichobilharzia szidati]